MIGFSSAEAPCEPKQLRKSLSSSSLLQLLRQFSAGLGRLEIAEIRRRYALLQPQVEWLSLGVGRSSVVVESLHHLESKLNLLSEQILASVGCAADNPELAVLSSELSEITRELAECNLEDLAMPSRSQHSVLCSFSGELFAKLRRMTKISTDEAGTEERSKVSFTMALSQEQQKAVECSSSLFLQGRSGTGKTLVLVHRILWHRLQQEGKNISQLIIVKSSLLRDAALKQLVKAGATISQNMGAERWATSSVTCITWDQLVSHFVAKRPSVGFSRFLQSYWPYLRSRATHLHPNMVWTEFNSRLRPFGPKWQSGLTKEEYMKDDMMAQGVRLTTADQKAIYDMFDKYMDMKHNAGELDDIDIAALLLKHIREFPKVDRLYIDEVQDFSPAQLMVLLAACPHPDGVTMAGDTCQTINPGSAFSFKDIIKAFKESFKVQDQYEAAGKAHLQFLHYNYRCAAGVAFFANSITWLLLQRFPHCADHIDEETLWQQLVELPLVVKIQGGSYADLLMGTGTKQQSTVDMRAATILVRDAAMRDKLHVEGVDTTILTIPEAKGLEFDFVVICGFLSTCLSGDVLGSLADDDSEESQLASFAAEDDPGRGSFLQLNSAFYGLTAAIHDLKVLYTGITRARCGCVLLECPAGASAWTRLVSRWQDEVLIEWVDDPWQFVACAETGCGSHVRSTTTRSHQQITDDLHSSGALSEEDSEASESASQSSVSSALANMMQWLEMELDARGGRQHRKARSALKAEISRLESDGQLQVVFCKQFQQQFGMLCKPEFSWDVEEQKPIEDVSDADTQSNHFSSDVLPPKAESYPSEFPPILHLMRHRYKGSQPLMDMVASLEELHAFTLQLLSHALDDIVERSEIFKEVHKASLQGIALADDVLDIQLQNFGRRAAPCDMQREGGTSRHSTTWRHQLCTIFQEVSRSHSWRGISSLSKWSRLNVWVHVFSFLAPADEVDLPNAVLLVGERVAEHARLRHDFKSAAITARASLLLSGTPSWTFCEDRIEQIHRSMKEYVHLDAFVCKVWPKLQPVYRDLQAARTIRWKCLVSAGILRAKVRTWKEVLSTADARLASMSKWVKDAHARKWRHFIVSAHLKDQMEKSQKASKSKKAFKRRGSATSKWQHLMRMLALYNVVKLHDMLKRSDGLLALQSHALHTRRNKIKRRTLAMKHRSLITKKELQLNLLHWRYCRQKEHLAESHARVVQLSRFTYKLRQEFGYEAFLHGIYASHIQQMRQTASTMLHQSEQKLTRTVKEATPRLHTCREAGRAYLTTGRWQLAATALTEAAEIRADVHELVTSFPMLRKSSEPLDFFLHEYKEECFQAASCWTVAGQQCSNSSPMMAWRSAEALYRKIGCLFEAAVCASQQGKWRDAISMLNHKLSTESCSLAFLCAAAAWERLAAPATASVEPSPPQFSQQQANDQANDRSSVPHVQISLQSVHAKEKEDDSAVKDSSGLPNSHPPQKTLTLPNQVGIEGTPAPKTRKCSQNVFTLDRLKEQQHSQIQIVAAALTIDEMDAMMLLRSFRWSSDDLINAYISDTAGVQQQWGVSCGAEAGCSNDLCGICFCNPPHPMSPCRSHGYCQDCWSNYLATAIADGKACLELCCPEPACRERAKPWLVHQLCSPQLIKRYEQFWLESYVESNPTLKWCPGKGCSCVAYGLTSKGYSVQCECGLDWCFACADEEHYPIPCSIVRRWREQSHAEDPDFEFNMWAKRRVMQGSVKPCPKCSRLIEKNGGCMHMTCYKNAGGWGHEFHWICLCPWTIARTDHPCPRAQQISTNATNAAEKDFLAAQKLKQYRDRFAAHREAQAMTLDLVVKSGGLSELACASMACPVHRFEFLPEAAAQVCRGRRILKWTIAFQYFLDDLSSEQDLFNFHRGRLEETIELLSDLVENTDWKGVFQSASSEVSEQKRGEALSLCQVLEDAFKALDMWMDALQITS